MGIASGAVYEFDVVNDEPLVRRFAFRMGDTDGRKVVAILGVV